MQLKELRLKKGSGMPMRGVEFNWEPGPRGWAWVNGGKWPLVPPRPEHRGNVYPKRHMWQLRALCDQRHFLGLVEGLGSEIGWALSPGVITCPDLGSWTPGISVGTWL